MKSAEPDPSQSLLMALFYTAVGAPSGSFTEIVALRAAEAASRSVHESWRLERSSEDDVELCSCRDEVMKLVSGNVDSRPTREALREIEDGIQQLRRHNSYLSRPTFTESVRLAGRAGASHHPSD